MKVIVIPSWYHTSENPQVGSSFREQTIALMEKGIDAAVLFADLNMRNIQEKPFSTQRSFEVESGIPTFRLKGMFLPKIIPGVMKRWTKMYVGMYDSYFREFGKPDLIHARSYLAGYIAKKISDKYKVPYVVTEHSSNLLDGNINTWQVPYVSEAYEYADGLAAVSEGLKHEMLRFTMSKIQVIPNFTDTNRFKPAAKTGSASDPKFIFLSVGGLEMVKGHDQLIKAFKLVRDQLGSKVELRIGGSGTQHNNLNRLIISLGLKDNVKLIGQLSRDQVRKEMQQAQVFVLASRFETFGTVLIEAMSTGLPVIATATSGAKDIVTPQTGKLVYLNNQPAMARTMVDFFQHYDEYPSSSIREYAVRTYSKNVVADQLIEFYKQHSHFYYDC